jgi:tripartite-type tricarboxylate transporter receptor subunit TctC
MIITCGKAGLAIAVGALLFGPLPADAQSLEQFYRGKTLEMVIGYPPGGSNDLYARLVARHIGAHIPGNPSVVPRNMPGAGSIVAANYIYNVAPKDGTVLGLISATAPLDEKLGAKGVKYEAAKFTWIGRMTSVSNATFFWHTSVIQKTADIFEKPSKLGVTGAGSTTVVYPNVLANVLGAKFNLVKGYAGSDEAMLAVERGEVDGHSTALEALKAAHPDWITDKKVNIVVQYSLQRHPELPDVPTALDLAKTDEQRQLLRVVMNASEVGKSVLSPPGQPPERVQALRRAFDDTMKDPEFVADVGKLRFDIIPLTGEDLGKLVAEVGAITPELLAKVKKVYDQGS